MLELNKIYNMDCLEGLKQLDNESIDLVVTSPPYNQNLTTQSDNTLLYEDDKDKEKYLNFIKNVINEIYRVLKPNGSFFYNFKSNTKENLTQPAFEHLSFVLGNFKIAGEIVWKYAGNFDSNRTRFPIDYEMIYHLVKNNRFKFSDCNEKLSSVWHIKHVMSGHSEKKECKNHPCPYPLELVRKIIKHTTNENDLVLDPFIGSGTTAVASKQLKRNYIGFELLQAYCQIAENRLKQKTLSETLLEVAA